MRTSKSWEQWIGEHGPQLVLFARRWSRDHAEAEDLVQEAFVRFWRNRHSANDPLTYLYRCVRTVATDAFRSHGAQRRREQASTGTTNESAHFTAALEYEEQRKLIEKALSNLPDEQAEIVTLKIWSELTFAQISEVTSTPPGTVASRYRYALKHLRQILSESEVK